MCVAISLMAGRMMKEVMHKTAGRDLLATFAAAEPASAEEVKALASALHKQAQAIPLMTSLLCVAIPRMTSVLR